jgi:hypothetical protein
VTVDFPAVWMECVWRALGAGLAGLAELSLRVSGLGARGGARGLSVSVRLICARDVGWRFFVRGFSGAVFRAEWIFNRPVYARIFSSCVYFGVARPAEPHEVIERIQEYSTTASIGAPDEDPYSDVLGRLASVLIDVLVYADETGDREVNPWLDIWRSQYEYAI